MPGEHTFFGGAKVFKPLADMFSLQIDQVNFVVAQYAALPIALWYFHYMGPKQSSRTARLVFPAIVGLMLLFFCFGFSIKHYVADALVCYILLLIVPVKYVDKFVFIFAMGYLSFIHWYKIYYARIYVVDVTGPMMILTQRVTLIAFNLHDSAADDRELTTLQKRERITTRPSFIEYMSYVLNFTGLLCGPLCFFSDYIAFIEGRNYWHSNGNNCKDSNRNAIEFSQLNPKRAVIEKFFTSTVYLVIAAFVASKFPPSFLIEANYGILALLFYMYFSLFLLRTQYYFAWVIGDCLTNASGFGFQGFDEDGKQNWDMVSNVLIWRFETANSWRSSLEAWNCNTMTWLRAVAYERVPDNYRTLATYVLSAYWHGFFPGYYLTFITGAMFTIVGRTVRRHFRPLIVHSESKQSVEFAYDVLTFIATRLAIAYCAAPFVLLHFAPALTVLKKLYFSLHIVSVLLIVFVPRILPIKKQTNFLKSAAVDLKICENGKSAVGKFLENGKENENSSKIQAKKEI